MDERGCRHYNPDDTTCRPVAFRRFDPDNTIEKIFFVHGPWELSTTSKLGELVVRETITGPLIKILLEPSNDIH